MSKSYRKKPFGSIFGHRSMKAWRSQENRRLRHNAKQIINICEDYDSLIIPILNEYDTLWGSPNDGRRRYVSRPYLNECELDYHEASHNRWRYWIVKDGLIDGHHKHCDCYTNKRSARYWKTLRK